ncbi:snRNA-activating protein complex subunit 1-like [Menidia menidia]
MSRFPAPSADPFLGELTEDVERLLGGFQRSDSVRFRVFCGLWREARFPEVFLGLAPPDRKCFCRVAMATAVRYFLPPYSYQIRVGGLYLMFALFHTQ